MGDRRKEDRQSSTISMPMNSSGLEQLEQWWTQAGSVNF